MTKPLLAKGKTKTYDAVQVEGTHHDDMTAGNGKRHALVPMKGELSNLINQNVCDMLGNNKVKTTFLRRLGSTTFLASASVMLPYEVVIRFESDGSYLKRNPSSKKGEIFAAPVVEFYLKTTGKHFRGFDFPEDDMFISRHDKTGVWVNEPGKPVVPGDSVFIPAAVIYGEGQQPHDFAEMETLALRTGIVIRGAWSSMDCRLVDLKLEFDDEYRVSDVITPDEWRLFGPNNEPLSKQPFRDGASVEEMTRIYQKVARLSADLEFWGYEHRV